jgi:2-C-methyl-D-erythritol 4-phosphate cytidylyltransferase
VSPPDGGIATLPEMTHFALIVAGGRGSRFRGPVPKPYALLGGAPVLARTLAAFDAVAAVAAVVLVAAEADLDRCREACAGGTFPARKVTAIVAGGRTRQDSVRRGLAAIPPGPGVVAIHDAVRPLVAAGQVAACIEAAVRHGAAILAVPAWDTLKAAAPDGGVIRTVPREGIWLAQTPQAFRIDLIREAHHRAERDGYAATDDAELLERIGHRVVIVPGSRANLKITTAEDLALAEALLRSEAARAAG